jgi:O-antigen/teichoic acid export membrane protein
VDPANTAVDESGGIDPSSAGRPRKLAHRILSGGAWSLAGRIGSMGSLFLLTVVLARSLGSAAAAYMTAASVVPLLAMLATMGVPVTLVRVLRAEVADSRRRREALVGAIKLTAVGCALTACVYWIATQWIPAGRQWQMLRDYPALVAAWFALSALCMVAANFLQAEDDFRAAALVGARSGGLIPNFLAMLGAAAIAGLGALSLLAVLFLEVGAYAISLIAAVWFIVRCLNAPSKLHGAGQPLAPTAERYGAAWYLAESWPNLINQIIAVMLSEVDLFWIACLSNDQVVADYGVIRSLRLLVAAPLLVAAVTLPPFVAELYGRGDMVRLERLVRGAATVLAIPSLAVLLVLLAAPATVIRLIYGEAFVGAAGALQILSLGAIVFVLKGNSGMVLTMTGRHRDLMVCSLGSLALYLAISPPLVARYGVVGAATAYTIQMIVQNVIVALRVKQTVGIATIPLTSWSAARDEAGRLWRQLKRRP